VQLNRTIALRNPRLTGMTPLIVRFNAAYWSRFQRRRLAPSWRRRRSARGNDGGGWAFAGVSSAAP
jgi:hypothetical protein